MADRTGNAPAARKLPIELPLMLVAWAVHRTQFSSVHLASILAARRRSSPTAQAVRSSVEFKANTRQLALPG
jgi:hypothetical protein